MLILVILNRPAELRTALDRAPTRFLVESVGYSGLVAQGLSTAILAMQYQEISILLPCHSLEDFPLYHEGEDAESLLAGWTALWHPLLISAVQATPTWHRVDDPPEELANRLIVAPTVSAAELPTGFAQRAKESGAVLIRKKTCRKEILSEALQPLGTSPEKNGGIDGDLTADFLALGYCYLQVELLTRQMRYASNLDEVHFQNQVVAAAAAAAAGEVEAAREKLTACFDVLCEERNHYYPVDAYILDLTLTAPTTLGAALRQELDTALTANLPINLMITAHHLQMLAGDEPESLALLQRAVRDAAVGLVGGEFTEAALPLLACETVRSNLLRGEEIYRTLLGRGVEVFGRRRFGLTPMLPQILHQLGFQGAFHATLEDGRFPEGSQIKTRWEGADGTAIDALARPPLDASQPESFLKFAVKMGESMDVDHVATVCLAHWPGRSAVWYDDLRRVAKLGASLGKFVTFEEYFRESDLPSQLDRFNAGQYVSPYLQQFVIRRHDDPLSCLIRYWRRRAIADAAGALSLLSNMIAARPLREKMGADDQNARSLDAVLQEIDDHAEAEAVSHGDDKSDQKLDEDLAALLESSVEEFSQALPRKAEYPSPGYLIVNPFSFVRRVGVDCPKLEQLPPIERPIYSADRSHGRTSLVVDVPPMGFVWIPSASSAAAEPSGKTSAGKSSMGKLSAGKLFSAKKAARKPKRLAFGARGDAQLIAEDCLLRNEFFEVLINPQTGGVQSIHEYQSRGNRISQQLAFRLKPPKARTGIEPEDPTEYSLMKADSIETTVSNTTLGEITATGKLLAHDGDVLAKFIQTLRLWRGGRVLEMDIELNPQQEPAADPWNSYYACRFAWANESAELYRAVNQTRQDRGSKRFEAPHYVDITDGKARTTLLTGGLPFHRKVGYRTLDSLLIVRGERQRKFSLGVGIDLKHPMHAAMSHLSPPISRFQTAASPAPSASGWLFHIDARNVIATSWSPVAQNGDGPNGRVIGFRVRLLETDGRPAKVLLSCFRSLVDAHRSDFRGERLGDCELDDGRAQIQLSGHQWIEVEAYYEPPPKRSATQPGVSEDAAGAENIIVTIDGPAGVGKSSVARRLAETLGFRYLDTGAMYRAVAWSAIQNNLDLKDQPAVAALLETLSFKFDGNRVLVNDQDVTDQIRSPEVTNMVRHAADNLDVRRRLVQWQRDAVQGVSAVTEGRDQGTVAFPDAQCKVFLTASAEERARRRQLQWQRKGQDHLWEEILEQQERRDEEDRNRPVGALVAAKDAQEVCTDGMTIDEVVEKLMEIAKSCMGQTRKS